MAGGAATGALPKATVKLQQTQPMARAPIAAPPSAPIKRAAAAEAQQFYEEKDPEAGLVPLSAFCLVLSVVLMAVQLLSSDKVYPAAPGDSSSPIMIPGDRSEDHPWETLNQASGQWQNKFKDVLPEIPQ